MKVLLAVLAGVLVLGGLVFAYYSFKEQVPGIISPPPTKTSEQLNNSDNISENQDRTKVLIEGLDTPWALAFLPDQSILVTERAGRVRLIDKEGKLQEKPVTTLSQVKEIGEGGLMGIAVDPEFNKNNLVYLYYTFAESEGNTLNRVVKMSYQNGQLSNEVSMVDNIPGASFHNGGRIKFGPDKMLYIGTGDAQLPSSSQDQNSLAGKILRVNNGKAEIGEEEFQKIRRGWDHPVEEGETLKDVHDRVVPYFEEHILPELMEGKNVLVAAHGNSLRALTKHLCSLSEQEVCDLEIGIGEVHVYEFNEKGEMINKEIRAENPNKGKI